MSVKTEHTEAAPAFLNPDVPHDRPALPEDFGVGSPIYLITPSHRRLDSNPARPGTVVQKARVWIIVELEGKDLPRTCRLRLDDQSDGSGSHYAYRFRTPEQHAWYEAQDAAYAFLSDQRITVEMSSPWRDRKVELARLIWPAVRGQEDRA